MTRRARVRQNHHRSEPVDVSRPAPGYYRTRLRRGGPWVPAIIWWSPARDPETGAKLDRPDTMLCIRNGEEVSPYDVWPMRKIEHDEYLRLCAEREGVDDSVNLMNSKVRL
jgi:hypothetical protein